MDKRTPNVASARPKRKPASRPSVIEATPTAPMPIVEATPAIDPVSAPVAPQAPEPPQVPQPPLAVEAPEAPEPLDAGEARPVAAQAGDPTPFTTAAEPAPVPPAAVPADSATEETVMDSVETIDTASNKAQAMFGELNERTKGAVEKSQKMAEDFASFGKGNVEAMVESSRIAARGLESLGQDVAAFAKQQFEQSTAAMKQLATVKSPTEFMKLQGDLVRQSFDQLVAQSSRSTETMLKLAGEVAQPLSNRFAVAAEKIKVQA